MNKVALWILAAVVGVGAVAGIAYMQMNSSPRMGRESGNPTASEGKQTYQLEVDGAEREFIVYRPESLENDEEVPVVFMFHGTGGNGEKFYNISGWKEKADKEGFMVVFPTAMRYHIFDDEIVIKGELVEDRPAYTTKWNYVGFEEKLDPEFPDQKLYDDVLFVQEMVSFVKENYAADADRFYATGFSNGSQFTSRLAVQLSDTFAAYAMVGSGFAAGNGEPGMMMEYTGVPFAPRPVTLMIGEEDPKINYVAGVEAFPLDESAVAEETFAEYALVSPALTVLGLENTYDYERTEYASHFRYHTVADGSGEQEFNLVFMEDMGHIYPNGKNYPVNAANVFWDFFQQYSL